MVAPGLFTLDHVHAAVHIPTPLIRHLRLSLGRLVRDQTTDRDDEKEVEALAALGKNSTLAFIQPVIRCPITDLPKVNETTTDAKAIAARDSVAPKIMQSAAAPPSTPTITNTTSHTQAVAGRDRPSIDLNVHQDRALRRRTAVVATEVANQVVTTRRRIEDRTTRKTCHTHPN